MRQMPIAQWLREQEPSPALRRLAFLTGMGVWLALAFAGVWGVVELLG